MPSVRQMQPVRPEVKLRKRAQKCRSKIVIPINSKPRDYIPNSGPPLQRVCLVPPADSTAYIVERILLPSPGPAADGRPLPKRMTYIVGWRDLPAARLLVPAMEILDYVAPRALEEWEWNTEMELDAERQKLAEERKKEKEQPPDVAKAAKTGKKRARPPAHTAIESAVVANGETDAKARHNTGAMILSTPKKTRLQDFEGLSDDEQSSPSRQLAHEAEWRAGGEADTAMQLDYGFDSEPTSNQLMGLTVMPIGGLETSGVSSQSTPAPPALTAGAKVPRRPRTTRPEPEPHTPTNGGFVPLNAQNGRDATSVAHTGHSAIRRPKLKLEDGPEGPPVKKKRKRAESGQATEPLQTGPPEKKYKDKDKDEDKEKKKKKKKNKSESGQASVLEPLQDGDGNATWLVKCLQDAAVYEVEGRGLVRYFKVLWEGDWPPDQNPTWEPEENIPQNLVRNFLRRDRERKRRMSEFQGGRSRKPSSSKSTPLGKPRHKPLQTPRSAPSTRLQQYRSVSEAFAGEDVEGDGAGALRAAPPAGADGGEETDAAAGRGGGEDLPAAEERRDDYGAGGDDLLVVEEGRDNSNAPPWVWAGDRSAAFLF